MGASEWEGHPIASRSHSTALLQPDHKGESTFWALAEEHACEATSAHGVRSAIGCHVPRFAESREGLVLNLGEGRSDYFLTMSRCRREALSTYREGGPRYAGNRCKRKFIWFTLDTEDYYSGKRVARESREVGR